MGTRADLPPVGPGDMHLAARRFQGARLTLARELRGLTRLQIAERVGKTPSAISQFEAGRSRPDATTLGAISLALGIPLGFFARPLTASLAFEACHFRTLRSASQRERRKLISIGTLLSEMINELDEHVEFPEEKVSLASQACGGIEDIEACASAVRSAWGLGVGPIPNLVKLLESKGAIVAVVPNTCREVDAFSAWHEGRPLVFLVSDRRGSRMRFDAGHELGHLIRHADVVPGSPEAEREANRFAAAFLLPRDPFLAEWPGWLDWSHIFEMKGRWRVSAAAIVRRAYDLGALSEPSYRRANVHLRSLANAEPGEPSFEYPSLLQTAITLLSRDVPVATIARNLGLTAGDAEALLKGDVPLDSSDVPADLDFDQQLVLPILALDEPEGNRIWAARLPQSEEQA